MRGLQKAPGASSAIQHRGFATQWLCPRNKSGVLAQYRRDPHDTGSPEVQIALLSERINDLGAHFGVQERSFLTPRLGQAGQPAP